MMKEPMDGLQIYNTLGRTLRAKYALIDHLKNQVGLTVNETATVMGLTDHFVRKVTQRIQQYEKFEGRRFSDLSKLENTPLIYDEGYRSGPMGFVPWRSLPSRD